MCKSVINSFAGDSKISIEELSSEMKVVNIENDLMFASVSLFGGQVLTWQPKSESVPVLWASPLAKFDGNTAIRAGVPICWPWFGKHPTTVSAPSHGYARLCTWNLDHAVELNDGRLELLMSLPRSAQSGSNWIADVYLTVRVVIGGTLEMELTTHNKSASPISITEGLHTYFNVSDVGNVFVRGLDGCAYVDLTDDDQRCTQSGPITFEGEVGRIFVDCDKATIIEDRKFERAIHVQGLGSRSIAVWNPGLEVASKMSDLGSDSWRNMVCVETANARENAVLIEPEQQHSMTAIYSLSPLDRTH